MSTILRSVRMVPGRFGRYGGRYVPETLMVPLLELERVSDTTWTDAAFQAEFATLLKNFAGRPTPLQFASRLTAKLAGPRIYLKREDLLHTGAHKINNAIGQGLLAVKMGKPRIVAETGAGQHGVASATVAAHLGLDCVVYMGTEDMARQALNVTRMRMLGAEVIAVESGSKTLKDAINEAMRDWVTNVRTTHYLLGSVLGAHPYPTMVRDFQSVIGREARAQILAAERRLPTHLFACVGGGSNSIGLFHEFLRDTDVKMIGIEAGGPGPGLREHAARLAAAQGFTGARPGVFPGPYTHLLQNKDGQIPATHSRSAGKLSRISKRCAELRASGELGIVAYITAGDPSLDATLKFVLALAEAGADVVELGIPFSDPLADGPTIQRASERALKAGATLAGVLDLVRRIRQSSEVPLPLFRSYNPILQMGLETFACAASEAGADGALATDLTPEESDHYRRVLAAHHLDTVFLGAPTSTDDRLEKIAACSSGFLYLISRTGVTGQKDALPADLPALLRRARTVTQLPIAVGFGISPPRHVSVLGGLADAGVVGSALVSEIEKAKSVEAAAAALSDRVGSLKEAARHGLSRREVAP